jgi:hypothetical protein
MAAQQHKVGAPVVGFNHNLNYKGRVFHVQTEDSGPQHGHIITHLFMGGNIFASTKSSYADRIAGIDPAEIFGIVRKLMEEQHKAMMKSLLAGHHDAEISRRTGGPIYEPGVLANGERAPGLLVGGDKLPAAPAPTTPNVSMPPSWPSVPPRSAPMASSLASSVRPGAGGHRPLATGVPPAPPVMVPSAISMTPAPPQRAPAGMRSPPTTLPPVRPAPQPEPEAFRGGLDEVILNYLASDPDGKSR